MGSLPYHFNDARRRLILRRRRVYFWDSNLGLCSRHFPGFLPLVGTDGLALQPREPCVPWLIAIIYILFLKRDWLLWQEIGVPPWQYPAFPTKSNHFLLQDTESLPIILIFCFVALFQFV